MGAGQGHCSASFGDAWADVAQRTRNARHLIRSPLPLLQRELPARWSKDPSDTFVINALNHHSLRKMPGNWCSRSFYSSFFGTPLCNRYGQRQRGSLALTPYAGQLCVHGACASPLIHARPSHAKSPWSPLVCWVESGRLPEHYQQCEKWPDVVV